MSKKHILGYVITAVSTIAGFFLVLYILGIKLDFQEKPAQILNAQSSLNVEEEELAIKDYEREAIEIYGNSIKSVVNITTIALRYNIFYNVIPSEGIGSGSIVSEEGHVLTNYHVIREVHESKSGGSITVTLHNQEKYDAKIIGVDPSTDMAVLKIQSDKKFIPIQIINSTNNKVGQRVYAIGNPFGLSGTLTQGIISSLERSINAQDGTLIEDVIQTDAAINPGNSGGPLLDSHGRMIGVNTSIFTQSNGNIGIGFAVSSNTVIKVVQDILKFGLVKRPELGIDEYYSLSQVPSAVREYFNFPKKGIAIIEIANGTPAEKAGLKEYQEIKRLRSFWNQYEIPVGGDIILEVDGKKIDSYNDIKSIIKYKDFGESVTLKILRDGEIKEVKVELF